MGKVRNRHDKLLALVAVFPLKAHDLANMLDVHVNAIWRDIDYLVSRNKLHVDHDVNGMMVRAL